MSGAYAFNLKPRTRKMFEALNAKGLGAENLKRYAGSTEKSAVAYLSCPCDSVALGIGEREPHLRFAMHDRVGGGRVATAEAATSRQGIRVS